MKTVAQAVGEVVKGQHFLEEALARGIVNYSALASDLQPKISDLLRKPVKTGAIMMALRRYPIPPHIHQSGQIKNSLRLLGDITLKSDIVAYTFENSATLIPSQVKLLDKINHRERLFYAFTRGITESNLMISGAQKDLVNSYFKGERQMHFRANLSAISVKLPQDNYKITGLYYQIFKDLAWNGIAVYDVVSTTNEFIALVDDALVEKAFTVIKRLKSNH